MKQSDSAATTEIDPNESYRKVDEQTNNNNQNVIHRQAMKNSHIAMNFGIIFIITFDVINSSFSDGLFETS